MLQYCGRHAYSYGLTMKIHRQCAWFIRKLPKSLGAYHRNSGHRTKEVQSQHVSSSKKRTFYWSLFFSLTKLIFCGWQHNAICKSNERLCIGAYPISFSYFREPKSIYSDMIVPTETRVSVSAHLALNLLVVVAKERSCFLNVSSRHTLHMTGTQKKAYETKKKKKKAYVTSAQNTDVLAVKKIFPFRKAKKTRLFGGFQTNGQRKEKQTNETQHPQTTQAQRTSFATSFLKTRAVFRRVRNMSAV